MDSSTPSPHKLQSVRGMHDLLFQDCQAFLALIEKARAQAVLYGFQEIITPVVEYREVFERTAETSDIVLKEMFEVASRGQGKPPFVEADTALGQTPSLSEGMERPMVLRAEGTAPVMRAVLEHGLSQTLPLKFFYAGPMFRYDRPQKGRLRQFHQVGVECIGLPDPVCDVEILACAQGFLQSLGIQEDILLELNTLGDTQSYQTFQRRLVDYLTPYEGELSSDSRLRLIKNPLRILDSKDPHDQKILENAPRLQDCLTPEAQRFFHQLQEGLAALNIPFQLNPRLVRGLDYYTHTTFEFKATSLGAQSTVLAGGRYDGLSTILGGPPLPGIGWAAGVERLLLLTARDSPKPRPCLVMPQESGGVGGEGAEAWMDGDGHAALLLAQRLRAHGLQAELMEGQSLSKRLQKAHKRGYVWVVIVGEAERQTGSAVLKNLTQGTQQTLALDSLITHLVGVYKSTPPPNPEA